MAKQSTPARWYMLNKDGMATLCADKADAEQEAIDAQAAWPGMGPHRAVQLVEAGASLPLPGAHVQNPAENEHVACDVAKNGAEMNMSTQQQECGNTPYDEGPIALAQPVAPRGAADGFFLLLPQRPKPEAPAGTAGLDWDAYSGAQMLAFGRDCSDAAIAALRTQQTAPAGARYEKELEDALRERDEADDFIDTLLDEVLGADRAEWSSAYGRADALEEVRERITALHKPAVDRAWKQFEAATKQVADVVAYLDVGAGGYLDLEAALSDEAMQQLPKGRHALVIAGTYGIDGYVAAPPPAPPADSVLYDPKAVLDVFNSARAGSEKPVGYLRGILAVIAHWESRPYPHHWMVPARADSELEDAARLDWLLLRISGAEFRRLGVYYSGNARRADVDAARKQGGAI